MKKSPVDVREKLKSYKFDNELLQKIECSGEETKEYDRLLREGQPLPENVFHQLEGSVSWFYTFHTPDLTQEEISEYLAYRNLDLLKSIRNCLYFFVTIAVIGIIGWAMVWLISLTI